MKLQALDLTFLLFRKNINIDIADIIGKTKLLPTTGGQIEGEREETIYKLNSVSETISEMAESYKQVAATTIETDEELEEDSKKAFKEELTNNIEDFTDNLLYEDFVYSDEEILDRIYDILEEKEDITLDTPPQLICKCSFIICFFLFPYFFAISSTYFTFSGC